MRAMEIRYPLAGIDPADTLALRLRLAREHAGLTVEQASVRVVGLSVKRLTNMELGTDNAKSLDMSLVRRMADLYQVRAMWLSAGALAGAKFVPEWWVSRGGAA